MTWAGRESLRVVSRASAQTAVAAARDTNAALLILDIGLVNHDASVFESLLMKAQLSNAVLCLGALEHRASFLCRGADAFVSDRAGLAEVVAQATRLLETAKGEQLGDSGLRRPARTVLELGPLTIELIQRRVFVNDQLVKLRRAEFEVLVYLALNRHRLVSAPEIVRDALDAFGDGSSARNQLFELRRKLREAGLDDAIATERGRGYRLVL
ncbi:MAG TPA: winged helix-turn-helix domain-containing protein [Polyangiaceae bacterium]|nr:winged helix-turn-helix domain-containing protein [Polyangiaceae bacterium]